MSEIERTFRVGRLPDGLGPPVRIEQAYLSIDDEAAVEVRVRRRGDTCVLTVKGGRGIERAEVEFPISSEHFDALWPLAAGRVIVKRRSTIELGEFTAEVDRFDGELDGLAMVEVEFPDRAAAEGFRPPDWFGEELTDDDRWSNARLATDGRPDG